MALVSSVKKIIAEDFPASTRDLIVRLAVVLNPFLSQVSAALNGGLTLRDNLKAKVIRLDLPAGTATKTVAWDLAERPTSVHLGALTLPNGTAPADVFAFSWRYENNALHLTFLGLDPAARHFATVIAQV